MKHSLSIPILHLLIISLLLLNTCNKKYDDQNIATELTNKAMMIDSYAKDFVFKGIKAKRMFFIFKKEGKPFYSFRSEWAKSGKPYVFICNSDGKYDYQIYPEDSTAYEYLTGGDWNDSNYNKAKNWHFNYNKAIVQKEMIIDGISVYELRMGGVIEHIRKDNGLPIDMYTNDHKIPLVYSNYEFNLNYNLFIPPPGFKIIKTNRVFKDTCD